MIRNYAKIYKEFIKDEIDIINPDIIVCCGDGIASIVVSILENGIHKYEIYASYHPSYRQIDDETFYTYIKPYKCKQKIRY